MAKLGSSIAPERPPRGRMLLGASVLIGGQLSLAGAPFITALDLGAPWGGILTALVVFVIPDVTLLAAIAIWGKPGYLYLKGRFFAFLKRGLPRDTVGAVRYRIGLAMFTLPLVFAWVTPYLSTLAGDSVERLPFAIAGDVIFLASFFVLGGDFWDKFRSLFVREAVAEFPANAAA